MFDLIKKHFTCPEIDRFEGVDFETFITLECDAIKEVIPEVIPRLNFNTQYKNYLRTINLQTINESEILSNLIIIDGTNNAHSSTIEYPNYNSEIGTLTNDESSLPGASLSVVQNISRPSNQLSSGVRFINSPQDIVDIPSIELKIILKRYTQKCLDNSDRILIGKEIMRYLLLPSPERVITREEFQQIAENIVKLLPKETAECYYTPSLGSVQVQGKLYTAYSGLKAKLRDVGLIGKRPKSKPGDRLCLVPEPSTGMLIDNTVQSETELNCTSMSKPENATKTECNDPTQAKNALNFLSVKTDDFDTVKHYWTISHKQRTTELLSKLNTWDYINMFPAFNQPRGYELISIDASIMFPNIKSKLLEISKKIMLFASNNKKHSSDVKILMNEFEGISANCSSDPSILQVQQQLFALRLIPHLLKRTDKRKRQETTASFFTSYKSIAEAEKLDKNTVTPHLNMIGDSMNGVSQLVMYGKKFIIEDPIAGFDLMFKSFLALSLSYPDECKHLWLFVQKCVYNIHRNSDLKLSNVTTLINDISNVAAE